MVASANLIRACAKFANLETGRAALLAALVAEQRADAQQRRAVRCSPEIELLRASRHDRRRNGRAFRPLARVDR